MVCLLLLQLEGEAVALEAVLLRGQAAKVGGPEVLRFGLAGTDTGSEPLCTSLCQDRGRLQRVVR